MLFYMLLAKDLFPKHSKLCQTFWGKWRRVDVQSRENVFFVVRFESGIDCNNILELGPWFFDKNLVIMKVDRDLLITMPVWVRLLGFSFSLWEVKPISVLTTTIEKSS